MKFHFLLSTVALLLTSLAAADEKPKYNVLFIISDDLTSTALSCYGNEVCIDAEHRRASRRRATRFTRAYCQGTYCGPSRASFMTGYYPHAIGHARLQESAPADRRPRRPGRNIFMNRWLLRRPGQQDLSHGRARRRRVRSRDTSPVTTTSADDEHSWTERFNSPGPEWKAAGDGETLEGNPDGKQAGGRRQHLRRGRGRW